MSIYSYSAIRDMLYWCMPSKLCMLLLCVRRALLTFSRHVLSGVCGVVCSMWCSKVTCSICCSHVCVVVCAACGVVHHLVFTYVWCYVQHVVLFVTWLVAYLIPDVSGRVKLLMMREVYLAKQARINKIKASHTASDKDSDSNSGGDNQEHTKKD